MENTIYSFEKLEAWKSARTLVIETYQLLARFPNFEKYALCDQIRRAVVSIASNIAEGSGRQSVKEKIHFLEIAYGSLMETYCQLILAADLQYITKEMLVTIKPKIHLTAKLLTGLRATFKRQLPTS